MHNVTLKVTLTVRGPVITKSTAAGSFGIDSAFARDEHENYAIPRGLIKGRLKQSLDELEDLGASLLELGAMLGEGNENGDPKRGGLDISAFVLDRAPQDERDPLYRIEIDSERGSANKGSYQVIESIAASGQDVKFTGTLQFYADASEVDMITGQIHRVFAFITDLGANHSIGFGELVGVAVEPSSNEMRSSVNVATPARADATLSIALKPVSPFCLAKPGTKGNIFESDRVISGGAVKGCVASTWLAFWGGKGAITPGLGPIDANLTKYPHLCRNFEKVRFTHAFPSATTKRPITVPYSVVHGRDGEFYDVFGETKPRLIAGASPVFHHDWKDKVRDAAGAKFGWDHVPSVFEVRNQHDRSRRKAQDEQLFSYEMVVPHQHTWFGSVDFGLVPDAERAATVAEFRHLMECVGELRFLGKTKARMKVDILENTTSPVFERQDIQPGKFVVTLLTPALLCSPDDVGETGGAEQLKAAYENVWTEISGGTLKLENYFAGQHLAGGNYVRSRFGGARAYNPFLLTDAGSVFVMSDTGLRDGKGRSAVEVVDDFAAHGLTIPNWVKGRHGEKWYENPYVRENGYGEITVNLTCHFEMQVTDGGNNG